MSSDTDSPRQRTVAELLAAHGETAVTGRRARRRAAEDAAGTGQAVGDAPVGDVPVSAARVQPPANGNGGGANGAGPAPYRNGTPDARPAPGVNGAADTYGGPYVNGGGDPYSAPPSAGDAYGAPYANGTSDNAYGAPSARAGDMFGGPHANGAGETAHGAPYVNGGSSPSGAPVNSTGDARGAPYVNGPTSGAPATRPGDTYSAPHTNGAGGTAYGAPPTRGADTFRAPNGNGAGNAAVGAPANRGGVGANGAPYVNGGDTTNGGPYGDRGRGGPDGPAAPRKARRGAGPRDDTATFTPPTDSDAAFVNGGAVYSDTEATTSYRGGTPLTADRSVLREPVPREADAPADGPGSARRTGEARTADKARSRPPEQMPRLRSDRTPMLDPGLTGPIGVQRLPQADVADEGPPTAVGMAPAGAEVWHRDRTSHRAGRDGGPPTAAALPILDDDEDDLPAGLDAEPGHRTSPAEGRSTGQAWAAVVAQWIAGAVGGAALWVGFRFLWRDLPVVALAAAALVTVGLVLVVRALMRNDDRRTTLFAVLVGLLLTVSPAILVLLGR